MSTQPSAQPGSTPAQNSDPVAHFRELLQAAVEQRDQSQDSYDRSVELGFFFETLLHEMRDAGAENKDLWLIEQMRNIYQPSGAAAFPDEPAMQRAEFNLALSEYRAKDFGPERLAQARELCRFVESRAQVFSQFILSADELMADEHAELGHHFGNALMPITAIFDAVVAMHEQEEKIISNLGK